MFKLTTGSAYARPLRLSFYVILITIPLNSTAIKIQSNGCALSAPPTQILRISQGRILPVSFFLDIIFPSTIHIFKSLLKTVEVHVIEWTAKCSDIQEQSATLDKSATSRPFADISKLAFTT